MADKGSSTRSNHLRTVLSDVLKGKKDITTKNAKQFLEAISDQPDPAICIQRIASSPKGYSSLQSAFSSDTSITFLDGPIASFLSYLEAPPLRTICGGEVLRQVILKFVDTPLIWDAFVDAARAGHLEQQSIKSFSWLLLQLVSLPIEKAREYAWIGEDELIRKRLVEYPLQEVRLRAQRILHIISTITTTHPPAASGPGGRHDNDFADINQITILPTSDELASKDPFLPRADDMNNDLTGSKRLAFNVDRQFRLLREDMLRDVREEIQIVLNTKKGRGRSISIENLSVDGVHCDDRNPWCLRLRCNEALPQLAKKSVAERRQFLKDNPKYLKHESAACLMADDEVVTLGTLIREENLLAENLPVLCLRIPELSMEKVLLRTKAANNIKLVQLSTAFFAYEPVLKQLQEIKEISLAEEIFCWKQGEELPSFDYQLHNDLIDLMRRLEVNPSHNLAKVLDISRPVNLDGSQAKCLKAAFRQRVSLIQGPPGTGKSFIGALIAKAIYKCSHEVILLVCYTHHALDQFIEELIGMDIPAADIVRIGSTKKATPVTRPLSLRDQSVSVKLSYYQIALLDMLKSKVKEEGDSLRESFSQFQNSSFSKDDILEHLEFKSEGPPFFDAFTVPQEKGFPTRAKGKPVDRFYLLDRWCRGKDAGTFQRNHGSRFPDIWKMKSIDRKSALDGWRDEMLQERLVCVRDAATQYNRSLSTIGTVYMEKDLHVLRQKRIIACTTTAAAKYVKMLQSISPGVLLVEEAGEILEGHILTALGPETKQMVLIGDHKQLRPKVHYDLSVEKGNGYDLNQSMFERLVLRGYPHEVLLQQHRMRPEISALVRQLTYPDLIDAQTTQGRPELRGFKDSLIFVNHKEREIELTGVPDWRDGTSVSSKKNMYEAKMTLKCIRYLAQQGYRTDEMVVLAPYLGQLRLLHDELGKDTDPVLNDLDSHDLVRAGLMPAASASLGKPQLRISTIDNFQGDESDIVVVSLTRSNDKHDIGFLTAPERLNVLISRARNALIMIGDAETFMSSRKGGELWQKFMSLLKKSNRIFDGFPVKCHRHPDRTALLRSPEDFDKECPDGGCTEPCGTTLNCGVHQCPQRCHQLYDHSKMPCEIVLEFKCPNGHIEKRQCHKSQPGSCWRCEADKERQEQQNADAFDLQKRRDLVSAKHAAEMEELDRQIRKLREKAVDENTTLERTRALEQRKRDLEAARKQSQTSPRANNISTTSANIDRVATLVRSEGMKVPELSEPTELDEIKSGNEQRKEEVKKSPSELEWERQKRVENASNDAIDALMGLTGLEAVKEKILNIKVKIETVSRQGTDMKKERLGMVMLGNPGTGKTTVARLYGQFLASVGAIPGKEFVEATGSGLANDGIPGAKKKIEDIVKAGGGVFFIDEAYQLASGNSYGGGAVLDFLLAEIEERVGTVVFILAGYNQEMEKFFEHNPGFDSRMPHRLHFADYTDTELLTMLGRFVERKYNGRAKIEKGPKGLYTRILIRRLARGRNTKGYGNARALENAWASVAERQANRAHEERVAGKAPDDLLFKKEDIIGPEPGAAITQSKAWKELDAMIGLSTVKRSIQTLVERVQRNYLRELDEKPPIEVSLNRIFLGNPGTGKTTVAKLYAAILADLGLLSKREVVCKTPADFVGSALGESERNTKAILKASEGKVLLIDEAYGLYPGKGVGATADPYKTAVIDTIVAEVQSTPGEDRCVLLLGYKDQMEEMLNNSNPGLARRFPISNAFYFEDFSDEDLRRVLDFKLRKQGLEATDEAKNVAIDVLSRARNRPNFGNAGEVENLISQAKEREQKRSISAPSAPSGSDITFLPEDFDERFDRATNSGDICRRLFADIIGHQELIEKLERYQRIVIKMKARNKDPREQIPFNFIFKGPPGTGKTTIARKMAQFYYELGMLSTNDYTECSASDLIAQFVGQSAPKTREALTKALGRVLFIDEAYRLCDGDFGKETVNELVDSLTKPQFMGKLVVILAGYNEDINRLLKVNPGLSSRFPDEILFKNMGSHECIKLLHSFITTNEVEVDSDIVNPACESYARLDSIFMELSTIQSWGNGRDIKTLGKSIVASAFDNSEESSSVLRVGMNDIIEAANSMLESQKARCASGRTTLEAYLDKALNRRQATAPTLGSQPATKTGVSASISKRVEQTEMNEPEKPTVEEAEKTATPTGLPQRDPGVSDEIWNQLNADIATAEALKRAHHERIANAKKEVEAMENQERETAERVLKLQKSIEEAAREHKEEELRDLKRKEEEERLRNLAIKRAKMEAERRRRALEAEEERRKQEAKVQKKLRDLGVCPMGYRWIKQSSGYRCGGGSHFVSNSQLGI